MTLHSYLFTIWEKILGRKGGENAKGLSSSPFLAINAKGGESIKPKAKGPHHHLILNCVSKFFEIMVEVSFCFGLNIISPFGINRQKRRP